MTDLILCPFHGDSLFHWEPWDNHWCFHCKKWYKEKDIIELNFKIDR